MRRLTPRSACTCCSEPMSYVFQRSWVKIMEESGEPDTDGSEMLMTSAVAIFLSRSSGDTSCSDQLFDGLEHRLLVIVGFFAFKLARARTPGPPLFT